MRFFFRRLTAPSVAALLIFGITGCLAADRRPEGSPAATTGGRFESPVLHYSLSLHFYFNGELDEAIAELEKALRLDPTSTYLARELAILYSEKGNTAQAIALCKKTIAEQGSEVDLHLLLAGLYLKSKNLPQALAEYIQVTKLDPKNSSAHFYTGILYGEQKKYPQALAAFKALLEVDPENPMGHFYAAKTLMELKRIDEAERMYLRVLDIQPFFEQAVLELGHLYEQRQKFSEAIGAYRGFIQRNPQSVNVRLQLARLLALEKKPAEAEKELAALLEQSGDKPEILYTVGLFYMEQQKYDRVIELCTAYLATDHKEYRLTYLLGSAYEQNKDEKAAIETFTAIPEQHELFTNAQISISMIMKKNGRIDDAIANLQTAMEKRKNDPELYLVLSSYYDEKKDFPKVEETLKAGLQVSSSVPLHYSLGVLYEKTDRFELSIGEMRKVLELDANNADALNFIGYSYADRGINLKEAERYIKRALELKPGNGYILDSLGWVYFRQNRIEEAIQYLREALTVLPQDVTIAEHLGDAYAKNGQKEEALEAYKQALASQPDHKTVREKIDALMAQ